MNDLAERIMVLYPNVDLSPTGKVEIRDEGGGPFIHIWDESLGPKPTEADLLAVDLGPSIAKNELFAEMAATKLLPMLHDLFKQLAADGALNVQGANVTDQTRSDFVKLQNIVSRMRA